MVPILYNSTVTDFENSAFLARFPDAISCDVEQQRHGKYEAQMTLPRNSPAIGKLSPGTILYIPHDATKTREPFDVYRIQKTLGDTVSVYAQHASYRLSGLMVPPFYLDTFDSVVDELNKMATKALPNAGGFTFTNQISAFITQKAFKTRAAIIPRSIKEYLYGKEGSMLDRYGPFDVVFSGFNVILSKAGEQLTARVAYGKNVSGLDYDVDLTNAWTAAYAYYDSGQLEEIDGTKVSGRMYATAPVNTPYADNFPHPIVKLFDVTSDYESRPTKAQLDAKSTSLANQDPPTGIPENFKIKITALDKDDELRRAKLYDYLTVDLKEYDLKKQARIIGTRYDSLLEEYTELTIGTQHRTLKETIQSISKQ